MSNLNTILGGAVWALVSVVLVFAALEPVSVAQQTAAPVAVSA